MALLNFQNSAPKLEPHLGHAEHKSDVPWLLHIWSTFELKVMNDQGSKQKKKELGLPSHTQLIPKPQLEPKDHHVDTLMFKAEGTRGCFSKWPPKTGRCLLDPSLQLPKGGLLF